TLTPSPHQATDTPGCPEGNAGDLLRLVPPQNDCPHGRIPRGNPLRTRNDRNCPAPDTAAPRPLSSRRKNGVGPALIRRTRAAGGPRTAAGYFHLRQIRALTCAAVAAGGEGEVNSEVVHELEGSQEYARNLAVLNGGGFDGFDGSLSQVSGENIPWQEPPELPKGGAPRPHMPQALNSAPFP